jgi:hypothetical protein
MVQTDKKNHHKIQCGNVSLHKKVAIALSTSTDCIRNILILETTTGKKNGTYGDREEVLN